ncbi:phospholipid carrier-dependent glycosyltransferase [Streptomyces sp. NPDC092296]|uniref:dolichyl-phosphate-mannose--protein mannosyltransferase n=1 Tax=Streptomyces sp. NPDC092296 TaxID=3366012 RepID=UPI0037F3FB1B
MATGARAGGDPTGGDGAGPADVRPAGGAELPGDAPGGAVLLDERTDPPDAGGEDPAPTGPPVSVWQRGLARFGYVAPDRSPLRDRLVPPMPDGPDRQPSGAPSPVLERLRIGIPPALWLWLCRWAGWLGPIAVAVFAGVLRFVHLGSPNAVVFDETYYAKDAWSLLHLGYEASWPEDANKSIMASPQSIPLNSLQASYIVHPPVGKWIIGLGEWVFGLHPFGWRFSVALLGTLSVLMIARIARRLLRSTLLGCVAGLLLSVDGLHFVMSRSSLLDLVVMFWVLAAFGFLLIDRDRTRARIADALGATADHPDAAPDAALAARLKLGWRPYRLLAGVSLGLACGTKWSGVYVVAFFGVMVFLWDAGARRLAGARHPLLVALRRDGLPAALSLVGVALLVYVASWTGWFASSSEPGKGGYFRDWAAHRAGLSSEYVSLPLLGKHKLPFQVDMTWVPDMFRSLWHYHSEVYGFHTHLVTPHIYQSNPWSWLVLGRPVSFFYESPKQGEAGCHVATCSREVLGIGTPLLWWIGIAALVYCLYRWALRRDWRAGAVLCGLAAGYLPWFAWQERTIFLFYAVVFVPFLVLAVTMMIGALIGPPGVSGDRRTVGSVVAGVLVLAIVWNFLYFFPIYTGETIPFTSWQHRMWFNSWI